MLRDALEGGLEWLRRSQLPDGSWPDFIVAPTAEGRDWPTGYITAILGGLPLVRQPPWAATLSRARAFLRASCRLTGGWGFNSTTPVDADSTAWCLLALASSPGGEAEDFVAEQRLLRQHQHDETGGFCTYRPESAPAFRQASGYCAPTPCVTAAVLLALHVLASAEDAPRIDRGLGYLRRSQEEDGSWPSFWWEAGIYSTAMVVRLLAALGHDRRQIGSTRAWLEQRQSPEGNWSRQPEVEPDPFLTSLALGALLDLEVPPETPSLRRGCAWLLDAQRHDGSWKAPPIMKVPDPREPWNPGEPYEGVVVVGHRRSFVTATVVAVLSRFAQPESRTRVRPPGGPPLRDPEVDDEVTAVVASFDLQVAGWPDHLRKLARTSPAWQLRGAGLSHYLPFWLDTALARGRLRGAAQQMALANRFGQFFCLLQDAVIDRSDSEPAGVLLPGDALFFQFVHRYQSLFSADEPFWRYFERYWTEYLDALAWEVRCCRRPRRSDRGDAIWRARKLSPIKICCAGMALLARRPEVLPGLEALIDELHAGWQLWDDLQDWEDDLSRGHWTWPLALARERLHGAPLADDVEAQLWSEGVAATVVGVACEHLDRALRWSEQLDLPALRDWIERFIRDAQALVATSAENGGVSSRPSPLLKLIRDGQSNTVFNVSTGALFSVEPEVASVIEHLASGNWRPVKPEEIAVVDELRDAGVLVTAPPPARDANPRVTTMFLKAGAGTSHRCFSCAGATGDPRRVPRAHAGAWLRAIDGLLQMCGPSPVVNVVFVCEAGTPSAPLISPAMNLARDRAGSLGKAVRFHLVSDALAADVEAITMVLQDGGSVRLTGDLIHHEGDLNRVLASVGGLRHSGVERLGVNLGLHNYEGRLADVVARLDELGLDPIGLQSRRTRTAAPGRHGGSVAVEATQADFMALVRFFEQSLEAGWVVPLVDVLYPLSQLYRRERRAAHCGAGSTMTSLETDGSWFPCFRVSDARALELGNVVTGKGPQALAVYQRTTVDERNPCRTCWAKYLCGGGCYDNHLRSNGNVLLPDSAECALITHRFEQIIKLAARIPSRLSLLSERLDPDALVTFLPPTR
jgi:radical SAM protein with 4Fe4S-binding SPASM domain